MRLNLTQHEAVSLQILSCSEDHHESPDVPALVASSYSGNILGIVSERV